MAGQTHTRRLISALAGLTLAVASTAAFADSIRVATFNISLARTGPGLLLKELREDPLPPQIAKLVRIIRRVDPDILLLNEIDYDGGEQALSEFAGLLNAAGAAYGHQFAAPQNTGVPTGLDLDRDGETNGPEDAFGYGRFPGQYGMAILSRFPLDRTASRQFSQLKWAEFPGALMPLDETGAPFPSRQAHDVLRLSSKSHWDVLVTTPIGPLRLLASHPTPPVFDGPEDFNGRRNHDEIRFWTDYVSGTAFTDDSGRTGPIAPGPFVILGDLNADPNDGDGLHVAIRGLLDHPGVTDPKPASTGAVEATNLQGGRNDTHRGDPALDTADWNDQSVGNLRVDYVLPSSDLSVLDAGVFWPSSSQPGHALLSHEEDRTTDHRLVWVDIAVSRN